jgi:hypothetical protein
VQYLVLLLILTLFPSFFGGNLIFRGHFNATGKETGFNLTVQGGFDFGYTVFLNGVFLGSNQGNATIGLTTDIWTIPNNTLKVSQDNVLTIIQGAYMSCLALLMQCQSLVSDHMG